MTLFEAKQILNQNGYTLYLNEGAIIDKAKDAIKYIKQKFKSGDTEGAKKDANELKREIKTNNSLSSSTKKVLLAALIGVMGAVGSANAGSCMEYSSIDTNGHKQVTQIGDCDSQDMQDMEQELSNYKSSLKDKNIKVSNHIDNADNARHLAAAINAKHGGDGFDGITIKKMKNNKENGVLSVKFSDGTGLTMTQNGQLTFYGQGGAKDIIGEYYKTNNINYIFNLANNFLKK